MKKTSLSLLLFFMTLMLNAQFLWQHTNGPTGSSIPFLCSNDHYAFASEGGYLYRSAYGTSWEKMKEPVSIFIAAHGDYVASLFFNKAYDHAVLKLSENNGESWKVEDVPSEIHSAAVDLVVASHGIYLYLYAQDKLYRSIDKGKSWTLAAHPNIGAISCFEKEDRLYLQHSSYLFRSDQQGVNWENITPNLYPYEFINDVVCHNDNLVMNTTGHIADTLNGCFTEIGLVRYSYDGGVNWQFYPGIVGNSYNTLCTAGSLVYANSIEGLLRSENFGATWDTVVTADHYPGVATMTSIHDVPILGAGDKGILRWDDVNHSLIESNEGITHSPIYDLCKGVNRIWAACGNGVFSYDLVTKKWSEKMDLPDDPHNGYHIVSANDQGWVVAYQIYGFGNNVFYFSPDNGTSWKAIQIPDDAFSVRPYLQIVGNYIYVDVDFGAVRTSDQGAHWEYVFDDFLNSEFIKCQGKYYVAGYNELYASADNGSTWDVIPIPFSLTGLGSYGDQLFAISDNGNSELFISKNGTDWTYANDGLPEHYWSASEMGKVLFYRDANYYYAFNYDEHGKSYKTDNHLHWVEMENQRFSSDMIFDKEEIYSGENGLYKGIILSPEGQSVFQSDENNDKPFDIYENPINGQPAIHIRNSNDLHGRLDLYSTDGILRFSQNVQPDATIHMTGNLVPGIYYAVYQSEQRKQVRSILISE